ncbi:hypothetical protein [Pseudomonas sp. O230]|uniref:hypothetical protein n=1 Tax=Pseudomonas sp. O230 TaxID=3159450 RepID=UPI00387B4AE0
MAAVADHYETHLAPVYLWMAGGFDAAVSRGEAEIEAVLPNLASGTTAIDLGAGFGMHTIPLARRGCSVVAADYPARHLRFEPRGCLIRAVSLPAIEVILYRQGL